MGQVLTPSGSRTRGFPLCLTAMTTNDVCSHLFTHFPAQINLCRSLRNSYRVCCFVSCVPDLFLNRHKSLSG